jgi:hypothetical protein
MVRLGEARFDSGGDPPMTLRLYIPIDAGALAGSAVPTAAARQNFAIEVVRTGCAGFIGSSQLTRFPKDFGAPPRLQAAE